MDAKSLMDSRKFCLLMDNLAGTWAKKRAPEADKEDQLQAVLDFLAVSPGIKTNASFPSVEKAPETTQAIPEPPRPPRLTLDGHMTALMAQLVTLPRDAQGCVQGRVPAVFTPMQVNQWCEDNKAPMKIHPERDMTVADKENWSFYFV